MAPDAGKMVAIRFAVLRPHSAWALIRVQAAFPSDQTESFKISVIVAPAS